MTYTATQLFVFAALDANLPSISHTHGVFRHDGLVPPCYAAVEQSQVQSLVLQLHRLGFLRHNPAHKTYQVQPYLRPHLAALAQQQPIALYSPSLLGWCKACLNTCAISTALYSAHAQVCAFYSPLKFRLLMLIVLSSVDLQCWLLLRQIEQHRLAQTRLSLVSKHCVVAKQLPESVSIVTVTHLWPQFMSSCRLFVL